MTITAHGIPVVSSRQWASALSPNAAGDGWNYIAPTYNLHDINPVQWNIIKDLTGVHGAPTETTSQTLSGMYPNELFKSSNQLRAANGRIFFPCFQNYIAYYEPTLETVSLIGPVIETPPTEPHTSTIPYSASFDAAGILYFATQESSSRPSCVFSLNPTTLAITILGYVGDSSGAYTTYGHKIAPDTGTAAKYVYVVYGESPWQLWALNVSTGATAKLYEVSSTGNIAFSNVAGQGWIATIDTNLGKPDNIRTQWWCLDGALYAYSGGSAPGGLGRNVTPASNPLTLPPGLDTSGGSGIVGWRPNGSTGDYTYVVYAVNYSAPINIESLVASNDGVFGNGEQYNGFFGHRESNDTNSWFGPWPSGVSEGARLNVGGLIYISGYPNGVLYKYDPTQTWVLGNNPPATAVNPRQLGFYGLNGIQFAGIKYARHLAWSASTGRLYCSGDRDRNGVGLGVGYCTVAGPTFAGVYSSADGSTGPTVMSQLLSSGIAVDDTDGLVAVATRTISGTGSAPIIVFNQALSSSTIYTPFPDVANLGPICPSVANDIIAGAFVSGGLLNLYRFNVKTGQVVLSFATEHAGTINAFAINPTDGALWLSVGDTLVGVSPNTLLTKTIDISSIAPVSCLAVYGTTMYMSSTATLLSSPIPSTSFTVPQIDPDVLFPSGEIGRALGPPDFFDLLISTLNEMCAELSIPTLDPSLLRATAATGKAQGVPTFYGTIVATVNACATTLHQSLMDTGILTPSSKTGEAFSVPDFYAEVISKVNDLINHL